MRWGRFFERLVGCQIGYLCLGSDTSVFFNRLRSAAQSPVEIRAAGQDEEPAGSFSTLFLAVEI
jgi:hypothetical protein